MEKSKKYILDVVCNDNKHYYGTYSTYDEALNSFNKNWSTHAKEMFIYHNEKIVNNIFCK